MSKRLLRIARDGRHVFVYARRDRIPGRHAARVTARLCHLLARVSDCAFHPAHDADVFAWVLEFESPRSAGCFLRRLLESHRTNPL